MTGMAAIGRKRKDGEGRPVHLWHGPKSISPDWQTFSLLAGENDNNFNYLLWALEDDVDIKMGITGCH